MPEITTNCLKAISQTDDELRVANYIVLFGGRDLEGIASSHVNTDGSKGEYFTPDTDFESQFTKTGKLDIDWEHGKESYKDADAPGKEILGYVDWKTAVKDKVGIWVERVLDRRKKYMQYLETLIKDGLIGNSSEAIEAEKAADGRIIRWALQRDSLTVIPMEPRMMTQNAVTALKSLALDHPELKALLPKEPGDGSVDAATDEPAITNPTILKTSENIKMANIELTQEEYKDLLKGQIQSKPTEAPPAPPVDPAMKAMSDRMDKLTELIEKAPNLKDAKYVAPDSEADDPEVKSLGDFMVAVKNNNTVRLHEVYNATPDRDDDEPKKGSRKTALAEGAGATGGYNVPIQYLPAIVAAAAPFSVLRRAGATIVPMSGKTLQVPTLDISTAPSAGDTAYAGGAVAYWTEEAADISESEPRFRLIELTAHKLAAYSLASNEVRADSAIESILTTVLGRAVGTKENYAHFWGSGAGQPLGIMYSSALLSSTRTGAHAFALADVADMFGQFFPDSYTKGCWIMNPTVIDPLIQLVSAPLSWMPDLQSQVPNLKLLGLPVYVTGALAAVGTTGDVLLVDPSYYLIGERAGVSLAYSEHYRFLEDQGAWRITERVDGQPWVKSYVTLEDAATTVSPFVALSTST